MAGAQVVDLDASLPDLANVRDIGGLPGPSGTVTRHGVLLRSGAPLFLDAAQVEELVSSVGVRTRVDLRSAEEVADGTNPVLAAREGRVMGLPLKSGGGLWEPAGSRDPVTEVASHYLRYLQHSADEIVAIARTVAGGEEGDGEGAVLVHCTLGKDRTGVVVAVLLSAVGVSDDVIVADYGLTGHGLDGSLDRLRALPAFRKRLETLPAEALSADPRNMARFLEWLRRDHGSAREYLMAHGVTSEELRSLADRLLTPAG
ncbi:tyrosine-protein phosphatase, partial [Streptomyces sp. NPDC127091]|uniref:tyrosine-protein phosphatase n=1 Tax=Streptomyces sp. NPDC127091 TaxID=3347134 RepID=UPI003652AB52